MQDDILVPVVVTVVVAIVAFAASWFIVQIAVTDFPHDRITRPT